MKSLKKSAELPKRGRGRPPWLPPDLKQVEALAAQQLTEADIARCLGIRPETLCRKKLEYAQFAQAIQNGQAEGKRAVTSSLLDAAKAGSFPHQAFYLERRCGWIKPIDAEPRERAPISSEIIAVIRQALLGELQPQSEPVLTTAVTIADKRAILLGRNGHEDS